MLKKILFGFIVLSSLIFTHNAAAQYPRYYQAPRPGGVRGYAYNYNYIKPYGYGYGYGYNPYRYNPRPYGYGYGYNNYPRYNLNIYIPLYGYPY